MWIDIFASAVFPLCIMRRRLSGFDGDSSYYRWDDDEESDDDWEDDAPSDDAVATH